MTAHAVSLVLLCALVVIVMVGFTVYMVEDTKHADEIPR